jgi:DNA mismatch repair protein MutS2
MKVFETIEFNNVKDQIAEFAFTDLAKKRIKKIRPYRKINDITSRMDLLTELITLIRNSFRPVFEQVSDLRSLLFDYLHETYSFMELKTIIGNVKTANEIITRASDLEDFPLFDKKIKPLIALPHLVEKFYKTFTPEGDILDSASPQLKKLRKQRSGLRTTIYKSLESQMRTGDYGKFAADTVITMRDDRYVIPMKETGLMHVNGIVHGRSAKQATVFIEPQAVVSMNNDMNLLKAKEKEEIFRIFKEFSDVIKLEKDTIFNNTSILIDLDFNFSIAHYCHEIHANRVEVVPECCLNLVKARHPLLIKNLGNIKKVIPFEMALSEEQRLIVISGPNTGGKTVTLKAVGLLTIMALSGIPIPADSSSRVGLFTSFFADIGDNQSLDSALSTFSSHIENIKLMLNKSNKKSIVLIDEIGSATDPEQGSALAQAILESLDSKKVFGVITTHYTSIKVFAEQTEGCVNGSMHFDPESHTPTYQFKLGLPGNSFAIEIAKGLGVNDKLIERAKELAGNQNVELTDLIKKIGHEKKELSKKNYEIKLKTRLFEQKTEEYEEKIVQLEEEKKEIKKKKIKEAQEYITSMQKELLRELEDIRKADKEERKTKINQASNRYNSVLTDLKLKAEALNPIDRIKIDKPEIGQKVWVQDFESVGEIIEIRKNKVVVNVDGISFTSASDRIYSIDKGLEKTKTIVADKIAKESSFNTELKILGLTFDEARPLIDNFIDDALYHGFYILRVVHGKGTGALRSKVRQHLRRKKQVKSFENATRDAGGDGVTIVSL